jgi:putative ABC transport system permease protein
MDQLLQDLRFGWRLLRRNPGFTVAAVLALALGVGATTAVFTLLDRVVLRPLPYADPDRLVMTWETNDAKGLAHERLSPVNFMDYRALSQVFDDAAAWWYPQLTLTEPGRDPMRVNAIEVSANFFSVLGVQPAMGAGFPQQPFYSRENVAVISHRLWRERFNADPSIVGKHIVLNGPLFTVVGVMGPDFAYPAGTDVWHRLTWDLTQHSRGAHFMEAVFRLKRGATIDQANAELRALTSRFAQEYPSTNQGWHARAVALSHEVVGFFRPALFALFGAAAFLLVITCTNVASLLLARATVREREIALRTAIGAGRGRLVRQFLTESVLLALMGSVLGTIVAVFASKAFLAAWPGALPRVTSVGVDARLILFGVGLALATAVAFGVVPALLMASGDVQRPLKESGRGAGAGSGRRTRGALVVAEVALSVILLVGAALLARSFQRLLQQDPGFNPGTSVTATVELPYSYSDWKKIADFYDRLLASVRAQPGVVSAGAANFLPLEAAWRGPFFIQGRPRPKSGDEAQAQHQTIDEDYFRTLGVPLLKGRFFDARDTAAAPGVVIVNDVLARRQFPNEDPLGQMLFSPVMVVGPLGRTLMPARTPYQVVGVVASVKNQALVSDPEPAIYFPFRQFPFRGLHMVVKGRGDAAALIGGVRAAVRQLDPNLAISDARLLERVVGEQTDRPRGLMLLMTVFAALALGLATLGIYSVMSYGVNHRRQEISVRMALGAERRDVVWLVVRQGLWLTVAGSIAGAAGAFALGRTLSNLLYGVSAVDATAFAVAVGVAIVTALAACVLPARRAASLDPLQGLRAE